MRKAWTLAAAVAALLTIGACRDDGGELAVAPTDAPPPSHITAAEFAEELAADRLPRINWTKWYADGQSETVFPLELRTPEEIETERLEKGRLLPNGNRLPPGAAIRTQFDIDIFKARRRIIRGLEPPRSKERAR